MAADSVSSGFDGLEDLVGAINFAAVKHSKQRRKDEEKTPYINHPIGVMDILCNEAGIRDLAVLKAAVLHDTVEDTDTTLDEVEENFGAHVRSVVAEVTDDKSLPKQERKRLQVVNAPHKSREAKLVKLADKLYNLRDLSISTPSGWSEGRVQEYFVWASQVVKGLSGTCKVLEDKLADVLAKKGIRLETIVSEAE
ncbi:guanosine-3',5'-bis(diphosphate) 3'-pyrophosphohydrolase MESH1-like [Corticium candelabrum]|uniref:guanosine-3',5'-bis(diphosphate) 3'-pyrophosphohydrolase MESH1-like n=1 Tax=Corticium candelabrum TaxID=121492 RepID=UPI002E25BBA3|nr:guanosine-3',5'-bis(diphosphate) 3'-pyrophosphohydrolase MESH1-like [Corticium candelabrum]